MATETTEAPFTIRSLLGESGVGSNGEKLVSAIDDFYPEGLQDAQLLKPNLALTDKVDEGDVKTIVGGGIDVRQVVVRGGHRHVDDAWVSYAGYDAEGDTVKGAFPYRDLGQSSSDGHVSQVDQLQRGAAARDQQAAEAKAAAATASSEDVDALRRQLAELTDRLDKQPSPADPEPVKDYGQANATNIAKMLGAADRATVARVLEYERGHEDRATVTKAAEKRIVDLDAEDAAAAQAQQALADENETLKARLAELEAAKSADAPPAGDDGQG